MRVLVTGASGKVGRAAVPALRAAGHTVTATDLHSPDFHGGDPDGPAYVQADLTDAGDAYAVVRGHDAVVHAAALPVPTMNPPHVVFRNNLMATFNALEAAIRFGVRRFVNISSETAPGFIFAEREFDADYVPVDEEHPLRPQDPYATAKVFGEQLMDAAVRRSDIRCLSLRPSWVQDAATYEQNLGPYLREPAEPSKAFWSYIDAYDLADAIVLAVESDLPGHEVVYIASPDNIGGRDLATAVREHYGDSVELRELDRPDAGGISITKARRLLGYDPKRSWRDYLDEQGRRRTDAPR